MTTQGGSQTWTYDANDNLQEQKISHGSFNHGQKYKYNNVNRNTHIVDSLGNQTRVDYDENSQVANVVLGNGSGSTFQHDDKDRVTQIHIGKKDGTVLANYDYVYDANNNRTKVKDHTDKVIKYTYDEQNQLLSETDPTSNNTIHYTYDSVGNRTTKIVKNVEGATLSSTSYEYNSSNQATKVGGVANTYDTQGNLLCDREKEYIWDASGRLTAVKSKASKEVIASYTYDEKGRRLRSTIKDQIINYVYDGDSIRVLYETNAANEVTRHFAYSASGQILSMTKVGVGTYYYHTNAHGDITLVTNTDNEVVASYTYDAWGNISSQSGPLANENPYRYAGYRYDEETKLYYLIARYYNPQNGNFISLDPDAGRADDLQSQNGYNYANNNPVMGIDPDGHWVWLVINVAFAVYDGYQAYKSGAGWKGVVKSAAIGFVGGKFFKAAVKTVKFFKKGGFIHKIGWMNPTNKGRGYFGIRWGKPKGAGETFRSFELHPPHKGKHNFWHFQKNKWNNKNWTVNSKGAKRWRIWGKRVRD